MLTPFQRHVAQLIGQALQPFGFALGGGQALQAHKIVDRLSRDLDNYSESMDPQIYENAEHAAVAAITGHGYTTQVMLRDSWFRQIIVTDPATNEDVGVDLGYDHRKNPPVFITGIGPVLDIHDVVTGKVRALVDRRAERDYLDIDAILRSGGWTVQSLLEILRDIRPELSPADFADILSKADEGDPEEYAALGMTLTAMQGMFSRLNAVAGSIRPPGAAGA